MFASYQGDRDTFRDWAGRFLNKPNSANPKCSVTGCVMAAHALRGATMVGKAGHRQFCELLPGVELGGLKEGWIIRAL